MSWLRIAMAFTTTLFLVAVATGQQSSTRPDSGAPSQSSSSDSRSAPCQAPAESWWAPFDTCKYLPVSPKVGGLQPPRALSMVDPKYSDAARKAKLQGTVVVAVAINENGEVDAAKVVRSLSRDLDQNAMDAAKQYKFAPATKDGKPVAVQLAIEMNFRLR